MSTPVAQKAFKRFLGYALVAVIVVGVGGAAVLGFLQSHEQLTLEAERERPVKPPTRISAENGIPVITLDDKTQRTSGIETSMLRTARYQEQVRAYGMVLDLARLTDLNNSYMSAKAQVQTTEAKLAASKVAFDSAQSLIKSQLETSASLAQAKATFLADQAAIVVAESQVRTLVATTYQEWGAVLGKALVDGSPTITRLIERQDFLLQITLRPGTSVVRPPATGAIEVGKRARAEITYVSPATRTDPRIQGVSFFYTTPAESNVLPGMNVVVYLPSGKSVDGVTIPASAIVWWQDKAWVYHRTDPNTFTRTEIATDLPGPDGSYVVGGIPNDAEIVMEGAQLLLSEEFRAQIQVGEEDK
jgi:hypothetical protein